MRLRRTEQAERDLVDIWVYIARDNIAAADRLIDEMDDKTKNLAFYPKMGRERFDILSGVRSISVRKYVILYRLTSDEIEILRYVHGRRDLKSVL